MRLTWRTTLLCPPAPFPRAVLFRGGGGGGGGGCSGSYPLPPPPWLPRSVGYHSQRQVAANMAEAAVAAVETGRPEDAEQLPLAVSLEDVDADMRFLVRDAAAADSVEGSEETKGAADGAAQGGHEAGQTGEERFPRATLDERRQTFDHPLYRSRQAGAAGLAKWMWDRGVFSSFGPHRSEEELDALMPVEETDLDDILAYKLGDPSRFVWMGHSTVLVQAGGVSFLTDPLFSARCSPSSFSGPKRYRDVPFPLSDRFVEKLDFVLISHNHYDHLDAGSCRAIGNRARFYVPAGLKTWFAQNLRITNCVEFPNWWWTAPFNDKVHVIFTPAKHWSRRGLLDANQTLWGSYAVVCRNESGDDDERFFFTGDTAYEESLFRIVGERLGPFDLAAIPIGAFEPRWFMQEVHCNPNESIRIHKDLRAKQSLACHHFTFPLTDDSDDTPARQLDLERRKADISVQEFFTTHIGHVQAFGAEPQLDLVSLHPELRLSLDDDTAGDGTAAPAAAAAGGGEDGHREEKRTPAATT